MSDEGFMPRNANDLMQLEAVGAQNLATMASHNLAQGTLPPRNILDWYGQYLINVLIAYEDTIKNTASKLEKDQFEEMAKTLDNLVSQLALLMRTLETSKQLVLHDKFKSMLKARQLHMHNGVDATYGGMLPA